jgi:CRP-like cAMP-binding protein
MPSDIYKAFKIKIDSITVISDEEFGKSISLFKSRQIVKGGYFIEAGQICKELAFIGKGILRTFTADDKGVEATLCFCSENRFSTSFRSFITQAPSLLSIEAIEDVELLTLDYDGLQFLYENTKAWPTIGRLLAEREYLNMENYALTLNKETAKEKYLRLLHEQPGVIQRAPVQQIASYLGITRETLSRIRNQVTTDYVTVVK